MIYNFSGGEAELFGGKLPPRPPVNETLLESDYASTLATETEAQLWPPKLRHTCTKPTCDDVVNKNVLGLSHSRRTYNRSIYEQTATQRDNIITYMHSH